MTYLKKASVSMLAAVLALLLLVVPMVPAEASDNAALEQQVVELINQKRVEKGVDQLQVDPALTAAAREQAEILADSYWGSYSPLYRLYRSGDYSAIKASVLRTSNVEYVVKYQISRYYNFAGLNDNYSLVGIGIVDSQRFGKVCVEIFAKGKPVTQAPQETPEQKQDNNQNNEPQQPQPGDDKASGGSQTPQEPQNNGSNTSQNTAPGMNEFQKKIVELVNKERAKQGLKLLVPKADLNRVAQIKAEDMAKNNYFSHTSPTYGSPFDMMKKFGINYSYAGENIAMGYRTPESVMEAWMNSPGHRKNILNPNFTEIGVGFTSDGYYWVQHFVKR